MHDKKYEVFTIFASLVRAPLQHKCSKVEEFRQNALFCFQQLHPIILVSSCPLIGEEKKSPLFSLTRCLYFTPAKCLWIKQIMPRHETRHLPQIPKVHVPLVFIKNKKRYAQT